MFSLYAKDLSGWLREVDEQGSIKGIVVVTNCPKVSHLFFEDDRFIFTKLNVTSCLKLKEVLVCYK